MTDPAAVSCPRCQYRENAAEASFCSRCGGALRGPPCPSCDAPSDVGDRYCTRCGAGLRRAAAARSGMSVGSGLGARVPWALSGVLGLVLVVVLVLRVAGGGGGTVPPATTGGQGAAVTPLGPTSAVDLNSMTPREAATRLFDRVMMAVEQGNQTEASRFLPMAIASYDLIAALSLDDRFHLSLLYGVAGDGASALAVAEAGLAVRRTHLLCLAAAAEGAVLTGDSAKARAHYQTLVDAYDEEIRAGLAEYGAAGQGGHSNLLPVLRAEAVTYLATPP